MWGPMLRVYERTGLGPDDGAWGTEKGRQEGLNDECVSVVTRAKMDGTHVIRFRLNNAYGEGCGLVRVFVCVCGIKW